MKRTEVQLDEATYQLLRMRAFERGISIAAFIREALKEHLGAGPTRRRHLEDFKFIASGQSAKSGLEPISERHDEALLEDFAR